MTSMENSRPLFRRMVGALIVLFICVFACHVEAVIGPCEAISSVPPHNFSSSTTQKIHVGRDRLLVLVEPPPVILTYHGGALLTAGPVIPVYLIWYGSFSPAQQGALKDFFASFNLQQNVTSPSVGSWWKFTSSYKNSKGSSVAPSLGVAGEVFLAAKKKALLNLDIQSLVVRSLKKFPANSNAIYVVFTAPDVQVESFCMNSCASHFSSNATITKGRELPYIWVGNPATQCPGLCAWPYAKPEYGPPDFTPLLPPNNDVGLDGMIISLGSMLAGVVTNPFDTGYYQGDAGDPLEAATACQGIYGTGAYAGYPGQLLKDSNNASYNVNGVNNRKFLLSALVDLSTNSCAPP